MVCGEAGFGAPQSAPAEEAEGCRAVSERVLTWKCPLRRKSEGHFPFSVVVDDVGAATGLQKKWLMAASELASPPSGDVDRNKSVSSSLVNLSIRLNAA